MFDVNQLLDEALKETDNLINEEDCSMSYHDGAFQKNMIVFTLDELRFAVYLSAVERVVQAVEITPLPKAPKIVLGVINVKGQIVPVLDIRQRLHLPRRDMDINDQFILARASSRLVALVVDSVNELLAIEERELVAADQIPYGTEYIHGVVKLENNLVLICDLDQFLSLGDERKLETVMTEAAEKPPEIGTSKL